MNWPTQHTNLFFTPLSAHCAHGHKFKNDKNALNKNNKSHSFFLLRVKNFTFSSHARLRKKFLFCIFFTLLFYSDALSLSLTHSLEHTVSSSRDAFETHGAQSATKSPSQETIFACLPFFNRKTSCVKKWARAMVMLLAANVVEKVFFFLPLKHNFTWWCRRRRCYS